MKTKFLPYTKSVTTNVGDVIITDKDHYLVVYLNTTSCYGLLQISACEILIERESIKDLLNSIGERYGETIQHVIPEDKFELVEKEGD